MEWPFLVEKIKNWLSENEIRTFPPATINEISAAEHKLCVKFPSELSEYLHYSNGLGEFMKHPNCNEFMPIGDIIWPVSRIVAETLAYYAYVKEIDGLCLHQCIFFADNGCGERFGYKFEAEIKDTSIFIYYPTENKFIKVASNLKEWAVGWFSGKIST